MSTITKYDFCTGTHVYPEGRVWEEYDGSSFTGRYVNIGGMQLPASGAVKAVSEYSRYTPMHTTRQDVERVVSEHGLDGLRKIIEAGVSWRSREETQERRDKILAWAE